MISALEHSKASDTEWWFYLLHNFLSLTAQKVILPKLAREHTWIKHDLSFGLRSFKMSIILGVLFILHVPNHWKCPFALIWSKQNQTKTPQKLHSTNVAVMQRFTFLLFLNFSGQSKKGKHTNAWPILFRSSNVCMTPVFQFVVCKFPNWHIW